MDTHFKRKKLTGYLLGILFGLGASSLPVWAGHGEISLTGSDFEIEDPDVGAGGNIIVDDPMPSLDWDNVVEDRTTDMDITIGNKTDDSAFGQGTDEDDDPPTVVAGGVPPNKSDLKKFGVFAEDTLTDQFIHMFWTRVQDPSGTTNMDFEFNQSDVVSANGVTPIRTAGDLLLQYDLANGGTNPELFLSRWQTAASAAPDAASDVCEVSNSFPCWDARVNLTDMALAVGSINSAAILTGDAGGLDEAGGGLDARTFGEASINLTQALGGGELECFTFGSAYLKSRSSDSFNAALKDFIPPLEVNISNCGTFKLIKKDDDDMLLEGADFTLYEDEPVVGDYEVANDTVVFDTCTTDEDGECLFENVLPGNYCMVETNPPANHLGADPQCFTFDPDAPPLTLTFINRRLGSILVKKEDQDGAVLAGAEFHVTAASPVPVDGDGVPTLPITMTENPSGWHCVDGLPLKDADLNDFTYTVHEETVPDGYTGQADMMTMATAETCDSRGTTSPDLTFVNNRKPGAIKISKTTKAVPDGPIVHPGVDFVIKDAADMTVGMVTTDANGEACLGGLDVGETYTVVESVPTGYAGEDPKDVEITDDATCSSGNEDEVSFHNTPLGQFTISYDSLPIDGHGETKATVNCGPGSGIALDVDLFDGDDVTSAVINFEEQATWTCTIVIDP